MIDAVGFMPSSKRRMSKASSALSSIEQDGGCLFIQIFERGLQAFARRGRLIFAQVHIHRPLIAKHMLFDGEGVTRAIDDNFLIL
jgi:hypothetical protein